MDNFEDYIRQGEPNKAEKAKVWKTAIGLQQVDGLKPSDYLVDTARLNIEGDITIEEVKQRIDAYYIQHPVKIDETRTNDPVNDPVKGENDPVFYLIKHNPKITAVEISKRLNTSLSTVKRKIRGLKEKGIIERIGSDKTGCWKIIE
jgi:predicted HTH transcriptional regulator